MAGQTKTAPSGHSLNVPTDAGALPNSVPLRRRALALDALGLSGTPETVASAVVAFQGGTGTWASVAQYPGMAGCVKVNLNPADWRSPEDRSAYLDACAPELICGDPISFAELAKLPIGIRPTALISTAMALLPGLRDMLAARFGCPVIDLYSMNESGPLAARDPGGAWRWLRPDILIELLGPDDQPVADGARGEITLTGGNNPYLPLLRYRTGDFGALYRISLEEQRPIDFVMANWFTSTHPESLFVQRKIVTMPEVGVRRRLVDRELEVRRGGQVETTMLETDDAYLTALRDVFRIDLGSDALLRW